MKCADCNHGHYDVGGSYEWGKYGKCATKGCPCKEFVRKATV